MVTIAATKEFLDTLFIESDKDEYHTDLFNFLKDEIFDFKLICDFNSITELTTELKENPLLEMLMDKFDNVKFNPNLNTDIEDEFFYTGLNEQNIFLTSFTYEKCVDLSKKRGYIYVSSHDISKSWKPVKYIRDNDSFKVTNDDLFPSPMKFDNWDCLDKFCLPLTTILIFDKYVLADKSNQKLKDNLFKLLEKLCNNKLLKPLNLTIISEFDSDDKIVSAYQKIQSYFNEKAITNVKLNILRHDKNKYPRDFEGLHYRLILTNNLRIKCDDSFNFFKTNGKVNNDADIILSFNMSHKRKCYYEKEINHIKRYVSRLENHSSDILLPNKIYYYTDKENYLFN